MWSNVFMTIFLVKCVPVEREDLTDKDFSEMYLMFSLMINVDK